MDYGKIAGFVDFTRLYRGKYYINYPVFNIEDIVDLAPDCVLMLDSLSDGENIIRDIYTKKQIPPPEILYLFDNQLLDALKKIAVLLTQTDRAEDDLTHELKEINALIQAENPAEALRKLESLATKYPGNASIVSALGAIYHKQNNKDKALSCYRRTVDLEPDNINYLKKLASYYVEDGNVENALGLYTKTLSLKPDDVETLLAIGQVCINIGQIEDGKIFFDAVIAYDPQNPHARLALNWTLGKMLMEKNEAGKIVNALLSNKTISEVVIVYDLLNSPPNYGVVIYMAMFAKYFLAKGFKITFIIINSEYRDDWAVFSDAKKLNLVESFLELPRVLLENKEMVEIHLMSWSAFSAYLEKNHTAFIPFEERIKKREYYYPYVFNVINQLVSVEDAIFIDDFLMSYKDISSKCPVSIPQTPYVTWQARYSDKWAINRNCSEAEFIKIYESLKILYPGHLIMLVSDQMGCDYFKSLSSNYNLPLLFSKDFAATFMGDVALILGSDYYFQLRGGGIGAAVIYSKVPYGMILNIRDEGHETEWTKGRLSPWATNKQLFINGNVGFPHDVIV
jgi:tetratricopeptide (TPR) repeat protein